jgi:predicted amidohydrolase
VRVNQLSFSPHKQENRRKIVELISKSNAQLDVFPEYCMGVPSNGVNAQYVIENAEPIEGTFVQEIVNATRQRSSAVVFTTFLRENDAVYNTAILAQAGEVKMLYRKIHLFDAFGFNESAFFCAGDKLAVTDLGPFKLGLAICFDLRFPEVFRAMAYKGVNLFIVPSGWYTGQHKTEQWDILTRARAHENVSYLVAANQTGPLFIGHSSVISPLGFAIKKLKAEEGSFEVNLDFEELRKAQHSLPIVGLSKLWLYKNL